MRLIDADAVIEKCGDWYVEEGPEIGFIGALKSLIDEQPTVSGWISVKDRLPAEETEYLCWFGDFPMGAFARVCRWNKIRGAFWCYSDNAKWAFVTHWMPLPEPPKDGDGDER